MNRLDVELVNRGIAKSRNAAQQFIKEGCILVGSKTILKASFLVSEADEITFCGELPKYVGRGGLKLETAINKFNIDLNDLICIDVGASTGGFTDCMLQNGARLVYAVDVGHDQLDSTLRNNKKVISLENTDIRYAKDKIEEKADFISVDVSFVSLKKVLPFVKDLLKDTGKIAALIKPQFETGGIGLNKKGIVKDLKLREKVVNEIKEFSVLLGFKVIGITQSAITGGDGNIEYLIYLSL